MKKSGFTLIELIFVIVIIGVLAATAIPKFNDMKLNAEISNMVKAFATIQENGRSVYLNESELNAKTDTAIEIFDFIDARPIDNVAKKWYFVNRDYIRYYIEGQGYMQYQYLNNGSIQIYTRFYGGKKEKIKTKLSKQLGLVFVGDINTTRLDFSD